MPASSSHVDTSIVFDPATPDGFGAWAGVRPTEAHRAFEALARSLTPVPTPVGDA
jgi:hypothetical protein